MPLVLFSNDDIYNEFYDMLILGQGIDVKFVVYVGARYPVRIEFLEFLWKNLSGTRLFHVIKQ